MKSSQKKHLCSYLLVSVTSVVHYKELGRSAGATENLVLMMRYFASDAFCTVCCSPEISRFVVLS